jgi:dynein heavy chain 2
MVLDQLSTDPQAVKNHPRWVPEDRSYPLTLLGRAFPHILDKLRLEEAELWAEFAKSTECELYFPPKVRKELSSFQLLMTIQTLRPDRLLSAMTSFAQMALGTQVTSIF